MVIRMQYTYIVLSYFNDENITNPSMILMMIDDHILCRQNDKLAFINFKIKLKIIKL